MLRKVVHEADVKFTLRTESLSLDKLDFSSITDTDVVFVQLPLTPQSPQFKTLNDFLDSKIYSFCQFINLVSERMKDGAKLVILGNVGTLPYLHAFIAEGFNFHNWIAVRLTAARNSKRLHNEH